MFEVFKEHGAGLREQSEHETAANAALVTADGTRFHASPLVTT